MSGSLLLTNDFPPIISGISTYFYQLWRWMPAGSANILAPATSGDREVDRSLECRVIRKRLPVGESGFAKLLKMVCVAFWALILVPRLNINTLLCGQVLSTGLAGWLCHRLFATRYIVFVCGSESIRFGRIPLASKAIQKILQHADNIIANSESTKQEYIRSGIAPGRITVITPGVDTRFFRPISGNNEFRERYHLRSTPVLLTVSRLDERKGHDMVLHALALLAGDYPALTYLIAGAGREEPRLKAMAAQLGVTDRVIFSGRVDNDQLPALYNAADIFILPNRETKNDAHLRGDIEGFGIVFLEAAACGKPVIAGNHGGAAEAVEHGRTGLLVNPEAPEMIRTAIVQLLENSALAQTLGQNGRNRCIESFRWETIAEQLKAALG